MPLIKVKVDSTTLSAAAYDDSDRILEIEFRDRSVYRYFEVPVEAYAAFVCAPSKGRHFNQAIRGKFRYDIQPAKSDM